MSYPYGGGGGYPGQGPPGGYPGYPQQGPPGSYPQPGYNQPPQQQVGMPTPESASAAAYGGQPGGLPYGSAPPGGAPGQIGFGMGGAPQPGYPQPPAVAMPGAGYGSAPGYPQQPPAHQQPGYPAASGPGYPQAGGPGYPQQGGYPQQVPQAPQGYPQAPVSQSYPQPAAGYPQQPGGAPAGAPGGAPGYPSQPPRPAAPGQAYGGYGQGSTAPGGIGYGSNVSQGHNVSAMGQGGPNTGYKVREDPTLRPAQNFNAENDAKILRKAMKGFGTDEKAIIDILGHRTTDQRQQIKAMFKTCFGKDLIHDLKSELGGKFEDTVLALMMKKDEFDAYELKRAMRGLGTDEDAMIEILCSRSNGEIQAINAAYKLMYRTTLEKDIMSDTSGHFKRLMVSMASGNRMENQPLDINKANSDAQALLQAGEKRWGTDESQFNAVMASQGFEQLRAVFDAYNKLSGRDIERVVKSEMSGNLEIGMLAIVKCVKNRSGYFAEKLYKSMKGAGTDDRTLIRVIVTRSEVDMVQIKQEFQKMYGQSLEQFVRDDTSGDYKRILLALVEGSRY